MPLPLPCHALVRRFSQSEAYWMEFLPAQLQGHQNERRILSAKFSFFPEGRVVAESMWEMSQDAKGCREVQQALEDAEDDAERRDLVKELHGKAWEAARCPHANHVLQKCIALLPPTDLNFIIHDFMDGRLLLATKHKYACRIVQRLLENSAEAVINFAPVLLDNFCALCCHGFGTHVMQVLAQQVEGDVAERMGILIRKHAKELVQNTSGLWFILGVFTHERVLSREILAEELSKYPGALKDLIEKRRGQEVLSQVCKALNNAAYAKLNSIFPVCLPVTSG